MTAEEVGKRIKSLREQRGLKKNTLANLSGVSPTYIDKLEKGERCPTVEYLDNICFGLGITLEEFFRSEPSKNIDRLSTLTPEQRQLFNQFLNSL